MKTGIETRINHHAPAADAPAIPQKSGGAFGIPEYMPPIRRQDFQRKKKRRLLPERTMVLRAMVQAWETAAFCHAVRIFQRFFAPALGIQGFFAATASL